MSSRNPSTYPRPPSVDRILAWPVVAALLQTHGRPLTVEAVRRTLEECRRGQRPCTDTAITDGITTALQAQISPSLKPVFNLTGTVLHTNLGRAPLPPEAIAAMTRIAAGASNLEYDLERGRRGDRDVHVERWLCRLTGAEAATVVNNNAAAVLLALNSLALRRRVLVSRGELIEIGGSFRLPDIMRRAGCRLQEVGTTNRTHVHDFAEAMDTVKPALVLKAHTSNYQVQGFTAEADESALADLCRKQGVPFLVDLGSGSLADLTRFGLPAEPTPMDTLTRGADLVTFSGDKLLGGPQAGIIAGRADLIGRIRRNPMKRAMRCDKLTLAALEAVLRLCADPDHLAERVPALRLLTRGTDEIRTLAERLQPVLAHWLGAAGRVDVISVQSQIGSGSLPVDLLPSVALRLRPAATSALSLAETLRRRPVPVIGRIRSGAVLLDLRCLEDEKTFRAQFTEPLAP
ncbi:MAG: L-seryl-tRNA(Sec) selenium transferase [Ectothiorhodospiraceae bacterium]|nr:L-seryl-tRNA(Sec) selenium transferase [Ectothiorhodospiraceae bacterium]